jgi:hypothetical protein
MSSLRSQVKTCGWVFDQDRRFTQIAQLLLAGDSPTPASDALRAG